MSIVARNVSFAYEGANPTVQNVSFTISPGECVLFCGLSGSGKTTLTRLINGLAGGYFPGEIQGELSIEGKDSKRMFPWERALLVGSVFQEPQAQFFSSELAGEISFTAENLGVPPEEVRSQTDAVINKLNLDEVRKVPLDCLSSGQKQKVAIASALAVHPRYMVFDEPSSNLDAHATDVLADMLRRYKQAGIGIVIAEHRLSYLFDIIDRVFLVEEGHIIKQVQRDELENLDDATRLRFGLRRIEPIEQDDQAKVEDRDDRNIETSWAHERLHERAYGQVQRDVALSLENLSIGYGKKVLVSDLTCDFLAGSICAFVGKNGCGKTTLAKTIAGIIKPCEGVITAGKKSASRRDLRRQVWFGPNDVRAEFFGSTVEEEILLQKPKDQATIEYARKLLDDLGLLDKKEAHPLSLSGGQKQRLSIACALLDNRKVIVLDEPTSGLDAQSMRHLVRALHAAAELGTTILVTTHDWEFIEVCNCQVYRVSI